VTLFKTCAKRAAIAALFVFSATLAAQPVAAPEIKVDDRWIYRRTDHRVKPPTHLYELRVSFVDSRAIHTVLARQGKPRESDATWTPEWNGVVSVDDGVVEIERGMLQFPLSVGRAYTAVWSMRRPRAGSFHARHERNVKVIGWENVEVPAGRFRALRIEAQGLWHRLDRGTSDWASNTVWYAPQVRRWVKSLYEDANGKVGEELVFYVIQ
jgi:hypothetical protein